MNPLTLQEIVDIDSYAALRGQFRRRVIAHKRERRVRVGDRVTFVFEDRETVRFQVQEMLYVEGIVDPRRVQQELDTYNELLPRDGEISATMLVEVGPTGGVPDERGALARIHHHVSLRLTATEQPRELRAIVEDDDLDSESGSAVHYVRFAITPREAELLADDSSSLSLAVDHADYRAEEVITPGLRQALLADLTRDPPSLMPPRPHGGRAPKLLYDRGGVRAYHPAHPLVPGHTVIEGSSAELIDVIRRFSAPIVDCFGRCRVTVDLGRHPERWHLLPPRPSALD